MPEDIEDLLNSIGPCLSSVVVERLVENGFSREAARQCVSRSGGTVKKLRGLQFPNRERFLFLDGQFAQPDFRRSLTAALKLGRTSYGRALTVIEARGAVPEAYFPIATGLPVENAKGQILSSLAVSRLEQVGLVNRSSTPDGIVIGLSRNDAVGVKI